MKNIIIAILLIVIGMLVYHIHNSETDATGQQETEQNKELATASSDHLEFKGIPIDGSIDDFTSKLKKVGFKSAGKYNGDPYFVDGNFAGYYSEILVESTPSGIVCAIRIFPENHDEWQPIEADYKKLKAALTKKYGKPAKCIEKFTDTMQPRSNSDKYICLITGTCNYVTTFETDKGTITLSISKEDFNKGVSLVYQDKENSKIADSDMLDEL